MELQQSAYSSNNRVKEKSQMLLNKVKTKLKQQQIQPNPVQNHQDNVENNNEVQNIIFHGNVKKAKMKLESENNSINLMNLSNMKLLWNTNGWIRVFLGTDRSDLTCEDPNKMMHVTSDSTTSDVVRDMGLPEGYTIWVITFSLSFIVVKIVQKGSWHSYHLP